MNIAVKEWNGTGPANYAVINESKFVELYGDTDLKILLEKGRIGDVIGQGRFYLAVLMSDPKVPEE